MSTFHCRSCNSSDIAPILSLGSTPLANSLLTAESLSQPEPRYPLDLVLCNQCTLVQIIETVAPEILFRNYVYFSSFSDTALENARQIAERMIGRLALDPQSLAAEIGSNDGYLLRHYHAQGIPVLGIEPATNIAQVAQNRGIRTLCEFFTADLARALNQSGQRADVIHANNVMAHVADLRGFVRGLSYFLKEDGMAVVEAPYLKETIDHTEFDQIYHEHLCYFSLTALEDLFRRHDLQVVDVERLPIHGGSLRVFVQRTRDERGSSIERTPSNAVRDLMAEEAGWGVGDIAFYRHFQVKVEQLRSQLLDLLSSYKQQGKRIAVYGASAKGSTLLNYFGLGRETLDYVVDRSTVKQGLYTPGTHLPILAPEKLVEDMPDFVLLLTWNFADEILAQQAEYRQRGGKFIIPIPQLKVV
jgi:SAM-dependent methyltransferase